MRSAKLLDFVGMAMICLHRAMAREQDEPGWFPNWNTDTYAQSVNGHVLQNSKEVVHTKEDLKLTLKEMKFMEHDSLNWILALQESLQDALKSYKIYTETIEPNMLQLDTSESELQREQGFRTSEISQAFQTSWDGYYKYVLHNENA